MLENKFELKDWSIVIKEVQDIIQSLPDLDLEAGLSMEIRPHLPHPYTEGMYFKVFVHDLWMNGIAESTMDIPLELDIRLTNFSRGQIKGLSHLHYANGFNIVLTIDAPEEGCQFGYGLEYDGSLYENTVFTKEYNYSSAWNSYNVDPTQVNIVVEEGEYENIKKYNNESIYISFYIIENFVKVEFNNDEFITSSSTLLDFINQYLDSPLELREPVVSDSTDDFLTRMWSDIGKVIALEGVYANKNSFVKPLTNINTWLRFDTSKSDQKPSMLIMFAESTDLFPHIQNDLFDDDLLFTTYLASRRYWGHGVNRMFRNGSHRNNFRDGWLFSEFSHNDYSHHNIHRLISHYFYSVLGSDNLSGKANSGSGMCMDINLSKCLVADLDELKYKYGYKSVYIYTDDLGLLISIEIEHDVSLEKEILNPSVKEFISDLKEGAGDVVPYLQLEATDNPKPQQPQVIDILRHLFR